MTNKQPLCEILESISSDCPGRFRCHGPASWCDKCGDVDLICDDPRCQYHLRGLEREAEFKKAESEYYKIAAEMRYAENRLAEAKVDFERWKTGNPVMVGRNQP